MQHKEAIEMYKKRTVKLHILPQFDDDLIITQSKSATF